LEQGGIIPIQDNKSFKFATTKELQSESVELHIHADCSDSSKDCTAQGVYYNDDGETLDATDFNMYHFKYNQAQGVNPSTLTLKNTKQVSRDINKNDYLDGI